MVRGRGRGTVGVAHLEPKPEAKGAARRLG